MNASAALSTNLTLAVLFALAVVIVWGVLTGRKLPLIGSVRVAAVALAAVGIVMCNVGGIGRAVGSYGWQAPITVVGAVLGVVAGILLLAALFRIRLPVLRTERAVFVTLAVVMLAKWVIAVAPWPGIAV